MELILKTLVGEFGLQKGQIEKTIDLIDEGNTIPFIARYRKEVTGGLTDVTLRELNDRLEYLRNLNSRKEEVKKAIEEQGKLTEELSKMIDEATVLQRVEDLYKPYKQKKATRASKARDKGLEPLAMTILLQSDKEKDLNELCSSYIDEEKGVNTKEDALQGAVDIIAEMIADDADSADYLRNYTFDRGLIITQALDETLESTYMMYYDKSERISKFPNHRVLAVNRGEKEKIIKVKIEIDEDKIYKYLERKLIKGSSIFEDVLKETIVDSYKRLIAPSIERSIRTMLTEKAEIEAIKIFGKNTENLLMTPPVRNKKIISIDPGYRTGCKVAVLDERGMLLDYTTIFPTKPRCDVIGTEAKLKKYVEKYNIDIIVIGNGTASRETEQVVADFITKYSLDVKYTIVNEAGASVYSASKVASEEYPDLDVTTRGAMSLGRRLQDPLAELVKIDPKHIGVGQYQHDMNQGKLDNTLKGVVEDCVNRVGVDLNTASASLLSYVSGINKSVAKNIVSYREENGGFDDRKKLLKVAKLGPKAYEQCAGFMRIYNGKNILDKTSVHPESYKATEKLMNLLEIDKDEIGKADKLNIEMKIKEKYPSKKVSESFELVAKDLEIGIPTLKDIIEELKKPGRDPRENAPEVIFRNDIRTFEELEVGMEMMGTVRNVVDFGAFVDIGVKNDGLVHISELSNKFIKHPMEVVSVGDNVKVKIINIDKNRAKVGLTMKF